MKLLQDMHTTHEESLWACRSHAWNIRRMATLRATRRRPRLTGAVPAGTGRRTRGDDQHERRRLGANVWGGRGGCRRAQEEEETELSTTRLNHRYANALGVNSPHRHVRTRLYFTSESHIHSLLNVLRYCNLEVAQLRSSSELDVAGSSGSPPVSSRVRSRPWITSVTSII